MRIRAVDKPSKPTSVTDLAQHVGVCSIAIAKGEDRAGRLHTDEVGNPAQMKWFVSLELLQVIGSSKKNLHASDNARCSRLPLICCTVSKEHEG